MSAIVIPDTTGLSTQSNDLSADVGSTSVADNVEFNRDGRPERRRGFKNYSDNIPDFQPQQLIASAAGDQAYLHIDGGIWYHDGSNWLRKRGAFGTALTNPLGCAYVSGHLYVSTGDHVILDINLSTGSRTILAGRFGVGAHTDGTGDAARFNTPSAITSDGTNLYIADSANHCIRKVVISSGVVTTLSGTTGTTSGHVDSVTAANVRFYTPVGIAYDGSANLYVCDFSNHCIRKVIVATGEATTPAGTTGTTNGHVDDTGNAARFDNPDSCAIIGDNLYVTEYTNHCVRKVVIATGAVTTFAGTTGTTSGHTDATGTAARFNNARGLVSDGTDLYVSDAANNCIRKVVVSTASVTTPVGTTGTTAGHVDGIGNAARFEGCRGLAFDGTNVLVADYTNDAIRKLYVATGYVTTIDGVSGVNAASTGLPYANGVLVGPD